MSAQVNQLSPLISAYVKQHCKKLFPFTIEKEIIMYSKKILDSEILTPLDDIKLLELLNTKLFMTYTLKIDLLFNGNKNGYHNEEKLNNAKAHKNTLLIFKLETGEKYCIYMNNSWDKVMLTGYSSRTVIIYWDRLGGKIRYCDARYLTRKLSQKVPWKVKDIPQYWKKMLKYEVWKLRNYCVEVTYKSALGMNTPVSESDDDDYDDDLEFLF